MVSSQWGWQLTIPEALEPQDHENIRFLRRNVKNEKSNSTNQLISKNETIPLLYQITQK